MKKALLTITLIAIFISCNNRETNKIDKSNQTIEDSILKVNLEHEKDSIAREQIFHQLGDTIFGNVCYGMSQEQANMAINTFTKALKDKNNLGFYFDGYHFESLHKFINIEELRDYYLTSYPYGYTPGCESFMRFMKEFKYNDWIKFFQGKLYSISWISFYEYGDNGNAIFDRVDHLVRVFENKFGQCNEKDTQLCEYFGRIVNGQEVTVVGRIAYWCANSRTISIYLKELKTDERTYKQDLPFKYTITIQFQDTLREKLANDYIDSVMAADKIIKKEIIRKDSIKTANAL